MTTTKSDFEIFKKMTGSLNDNSTWTKKVPLFAMISNFALSLIISWHLFLLGEFASSHSRAFSFDLVDLSIGWNLPSSAFCKAGFVDRLGLFMVSQISWTFCVMTFLDLVFSLTDESISSIHRFLLERQQIPYESVMGHKLCQPFLLCSFPFSENPGKIEMIDLFDSGDSSQYNPSCLMSPAGHHEKSRVEVTTMLFISWCFFLLILSSLEKKVMGKHLLTSRL
ncbi:hypothetical protein STEG23_017648 [Scotinomys teguina]